jgi:TRAP-type transport system small permease protein
VHRILYHTGQWMSAIALIVLVSMTVTDIVLRWAFNSPIYGSNEIANFLLALTVGAGLVVTTSTRGHIKVDLVEPFLLRRFGPRYYLFTACIELLGTLLFAGLVGLYAYEASVFGEVSVVLEWPVAPVFLVSACFATLSALYIVKPCRYESRTASQIKSEELS